MIKRGDEFPVLAAKVSETRHLIKVVAAICKDKHDGSDRDEHRLRALCCLDKFYQTLRDAHVVLAPSEVACALAGVEWHLLRYNWLRDYAAQQGQRRYVLQYKQHKLWHIAKDATFLIPMYHWCYPL